MDMIARSLVCHTIRHQLFAFTASSYVKFHLAGHSSLWRLAYAERQARQCTGHGGVPRASQSTVLGGSSQVTEFDLLVGRVDCGMLCKKNIGEI